MIKPLELCPCGQQVENQRLSYQACCQPYHLGELPQTPEQLMRSRYSAFVLKLHDYLIATHHPQHLNGLTKTTLDQEAKNWDCHNFSEMESGQKNGDRHNFWLGLNVNHSQMNGDKGSVEFHAWYKDKGELDAIHEVSQFVREEGRWFYTTGEQLNPIYPKRNEMCICNSGKKFKQCCLK